MLSHLCLLFVFFYGSVGVAFESDRRLEGTVFGDFDRLMLVCV